MPDIDDYEHRGFLALARAAAADMAVSSIKAPPMPVWKAGDLQSIFTLQTGLRESGLLPSKFDDAAGATPPWAGQVNNLGTDISGLVTAPVKPDEPEPNPTSPFGPMDPKLIKGEASTVYKHPEGGYTPLDLVKEWIRPTPPPPPINEGYIKGQPANENAERLFQDPDAGIWP